MTTVAIIQARMGSTRLPGKVLMPLAGRPVIARVVDRVRASKAFDEVVVATTMLPRDDELAAVAASNGVRVVRGSEDDVLERYCIAADASGASTIMRITADCPLIDPDVLARMVQSSNVTPSPDLVTNARVRTFPRGLDAEVFTRAALEVMRDAALAPHEREHVTPFLYAHPERFRILDVTHHEDLSALRWTLDTPEDYDLLKRIYATAGSPEALRLADVLAILSAHPDWSQINADIKQKEI